MISGDSGDTESLENPQDKSTGYYPIDGEIVLGPGTLWTAYPIPAVKVLTWSNNGRARNVLLALLAFSGKRVGRVFPSVITIAEYSGVGRNNIKAALDTLVKFGFINIEKTKIGRKNSRNSYTFNLGCWSYRFTVMVLTYSLRRRLLNIINKQVVSYGTYLQSS